MDGTSCPSLKVVYIAPFFFFSPLNNSVREARQKESDWPKIIQEATMPCMKMLPFGPYSTKALAHLFLARHHTASVTKTYILQSRKSFVNFAKFKISKTEWKQYTQVFIDFVLRARFLILIFSCRV